MSKLPLETRPIRVAPDIARFLEESLRPFSGKKLEAAQAAVLRVYHSGAQMPHDQWVALYRRVIGEATTDKQAVG